MQDGDTNDRTYYKLDEKEYQFNRAKIRNIKASKGAAIIHFKGNY